MTKMLQFVIRKSHRQLHCILHLVREDCVSFVGLDLYISLCGQQHPKCERAIRLMHPYLS